MAELVLVTGASGFVATHVVKQLLEEGYRVRGTVRSLTNKDRIKHLENLVPGAKEKLHLVEADLLDESCWVNVVRGCDYVMHVASPYIFKVQNDDEVIKPAVDGTLSVLKACTESGSVKRVVVTGSCTSVFGAPKIHGKHYTEEDWGDEKTTTPYTRSKILAERAAWDYVASFGDEKPFELTVMNPSYIFGPFIGSGDPTSFLMPKMILSGSKALPNVNVNGVDVRDVAKAHVIGMKLPEAAGKRHILSPYAIWTSDMAKMISDEFTPQGFKVTTKIAPSWLLKMMSYVVSSLGQVVPMLDKESVMDNTRMTIVLGITPIDEKDSVLSLTYSMIEAGVVPKTAQYTGPK